MPDLTEWKVKQNDLETGGACGVLGKASGFAYEKDLKALSKVIGLDDFEGARDKLNVILFQ